jgi:hypothetical protein
MIHDIHSNIEQNPTTHPGTNVYGFSYLEKYTDILKAMQESNIGKGINLELSLSVEIEELVVHPPLSSGIGASSGHYR